MCDGGGFRGGRDEDEDAACRGKRGRGDGDAVFRLHGGARNGETLFALVQRRGKREERSNVSVGAHAEQHEVDGIGKGASVVRRDCFSVRLLRANPMNVRLGNSDGIQ